MRALETAADERGRLDLPRSTLLMLVCAFGGYDAVMAAYREAVKEGYRFYSYGDARAVV